MQNGFEASDLRIKRLPMYIHIYLKMDYMYTYNSRNFYGKLNLQLLRITFFMLHLHYDSKVTPH